MRNHRCKKVDGEQGSKEAKKFPNVQLFEQNKLQRDFYIMKERAFFQLRKESQEKNADS